MMQMEWRVELMWMDMGGVGAMSLGRRRKGEKGGEKEVLGRYLITYLLIYIYRSKETTCPALLCSALL